MSAVARPYAVAAFAFARERNAVREWRAAVDAVAEAARSVFAAVAGRPPIPQRELAEAVCEVASRLSPDGMAAAGREARNFVFALAENRRLASAPEVAAMFAEFQMDGEGAARVEIETAAPIPDAAKAALESALSRKLGGNVSASYRENPSLRGGARVRIRDDVLDASVAGRLARLAAVLKNQE